MDCLARRDLLVHRPHTASIRPPVDTASRSIEITSAEVFQPARKLRAGPPSVLRQVRIGRVKTEASQDEVPLDPAFAEILRNCKGQRTEGLVFPSPVTGGCYYTCIVQRQILEPRGEEIGIPGLGWHTFRHTYRALLDETGAPIEVQQKLMRHSNVATTMNVLRQCDNTSEAGSKLESCADGYGADAGTAASGA